MNDEELLTTMRKSFTEVQSHTPVERIVSRSRAVRARRWITGVAGALALAAGVAVAVTTLVPAGRQPDHPAPAELAAWTVVKQADGSIAVTIRELHDPAGLQATLRGAGVPASVTFYGRPNPACRVDPRAAGLTSKVIRFGNPQLRHPPRPGNFRSALQRARQRLGTYPVYLIDPSALPHGVGVQLAATARSLPSRNKSIEVTVTGHLVYSSPQCTGG